MPETPVTLNPKHQSNGVLLKIIIGLLSVSGTLFSIIGLGVLNRIDEMQKDIKGLSPISATHTEQIKSQGEDIVSIKNDLKALDDFKSQFTAMFALKPDEIVVRRRRQEN